MIGKGLAQRNSLSTLVFVVWELEVHAAAVQIETFAEQVEAHDYTLAVPARTAIAPRRRPTGFARLADFPQRKVGRVALVLGAEDLAIAATGKQALEILIRQESVVVHGLDTEIYAIGGGVGAIDCDQFANHLDHLVDVFGGVRDIGGAGHIEALHCVEPHVFAFASDLLPRAVLAFGPVDDLVVDVGDVADQANLNACPLEITTQHVVHQCGAAVTEVRRPVDRGAAEIDAEMARLAHGQWTHCLGRCVEEVKHQPTA